jgi:hypothetical protein
VCRFITGYCHAAIFGVNPLYSIQNHNCGGPHGDPWHTACVRFVTKWKLLVLHKEPAATVNNNYLSRKTRDVWQQNCKNICSKICQTSQNYKNICSQIYQTTQNSRSVKQHKTLRTSAARPDKHHKTLKNICSRICQTSENSKNICSQIYQTTQNSRSVKQHKL